VESRYIAPLNLRSIARLDALGVQVEADCWQERREKVWLARPF